jgi:ubiquinone/menaquinone biosynthesis C-methylase UbiE
MTDHLRSQWQANARAYSKLIEGKGTPHHREILNPCIERLMGDVQGKDMLDAGCGEGYISRFYAQKGAKVTGVDFSPNLILEAKKYSQNFDITYLVGDICQLEDFQANQFDIVLCNLVLLNVDCLESSLQEFHRVLRSGGFLIFSVVHPAFNVYGHGQWELGEKDPTTGRRKGQYFKTDNYHTEKEFQVRWKSRAGKGFPQKFSFFHRTISTYVNTVIESGFQIVVFVEPLPTSDAPFFERERRVPFFLVIKAEKS